MCEHKDKICQKLLKYGIQIINSDGSFRDFQDVFSDILDVLEKIKNSTTREEYEIHKEYIAIILYGIRHKNILYRIID